MNTRRELAPDPLKVLLENAPIDDEPIDLADLEFDESEPSVPHVAVMRRFRE